MIEAGVVVFNYSGRGWLMLNKLSRLSLVRHALARQIGLFDDCAEETRVCIAGPSFLRKTGHFREIELATSLAVLLNHFVLKLLVICIGKLLIRP